MAAHFFPKEPVPPVIRIELLSNINADQVRALPPPAKNSSLVGVHVELGLSLAREVAQLGNQSQSGARVLRKNSLERRWKPNKSFTAFAGFCTRRGRLSLHNGAVGNAGR